VHTIKFVRIHVVETNGYANRGILVESYRRRSIKRAKVADFCGESDPPELAFWWSKFIKVLNSHDEKLVFLR
jgi:hypothetical protein